MTHAEASQQLLTCARKLNASGLNRGTSGNLSVRVPGGFLLTPSGMDYDGLVESDLCALDADGAPVSGARKPSSEWRIHADLFRLRPEVNGIVHAHPMFSTSLAILRRDLPAVHYMIGVAGGPTVRCAQYATFGTPELSAFVQQALEGRKAALMANHGLIAVGETLAEAFKVAREIESVAEQYWRALQVGTPIILDDEEMARVVEKLRTYGQGC